MFLFRCCINSGCSRLSEAERDVGGTLSSATESNEDQLHSRLLPAAIDVQHGKRADYSGCSQNVVTTQPFPADSRSANDAEGNACTLLQPGEDLCRSGESGFGETSSLHLDQPSETAINGTCDTERNDIVNNNSETNQSNLVSSVTPSKDSLLVSSGMSSCLDEQKDSDASDDDSSNETSPEVKYVADIKQFQSSLCFCYGQDTVDNTYVPCTCNNLNVKPEDDRTVYEDICDLSNKLSAKCEELSSDLYQLNANVTESREINNFQPAQSIVLADINQEFCRPDIYSYILSSSQKCSETNSCNIQEMKEYSDTVLSDATVKVAQECNDASSESDNESSTDENSIHFICSFTNGLYKKKPDVCEHLSPVYGKPTSVCKWTEFRTEQNNESSSFRDQLMSSDSTARCSYNEVSSSVVIPVNESATMSKLQTACVCDEHVTDDINILCNDIDGLVTLQSVVTNTSGVNCAECVCVDSAGNLESAVYHNVNVADTSVTYTAEMSSVVDEPSPCLHHPQPALQTSGDVNICNDDVVKYVDEIVKHAVISTREACTQNNNKLNVSDNVQQPADLTQGEDICIIDVKAYVDEVVKHAVLAVEQEAGCTVDVKALNCDLSQQHVTKSSGGISVCSDNIAMYVDEIVKYATASIAQDNNIMGSEDLSQVEQLPAKSPDSGDIDVDDIVPFVDDIVKHAIVIVAQERYSNSDTCVVGFEQTLDVASDDHQQDDAMTVGDISSTDDIQRKDGSYSPHENDEVSQPMLPSSVQALAVNADNLHPSGCILEQSTDDSSSMSHECHHEDNIRENYCDDGSIVQECHEERISPQECNIECAKVNTESDAAEDTSYNSGNVPQFIDDNDVAQKFDAGDESLDHNLAETTTSLDSVEISCELLSHKTSDTECVYSIRVQSVDQEESFLSCYKPQPQGFPEYRCESDFIVDVEQKEKSSAEKHENMSVMPSTPFSASNHNTSAANYSEPILEEQLVINVAQYDNKTMATEYMSDTLCCDFMVSEQNLMSELFSDEQNQNITLKWKTSDEPSVLHASTIEPNKHMQLKRGYAESHEPSYEEQWTTEIQCGETAVEKLNTSEANIEDMQMENVESDNTGPYKTKSEPGACILEMAVNFTCERKSCVRPTSLPQQDSNASTLSPPASSPSRKYSPTTELVNEFFEQYVLPIANERRDNRLTSVSSPSKSLDVDIALDDLELQLDNDIIETSKPTVTATLVSGETDGKGMSNDDIISPDRLYRRISLPDSTPRRKKSVRFADSVGCDLELVRHIEVTRDDMPTNIDEYLQGLMAATDRRARWAERHPRQGVVATAWHCESSTYLHALFEQQGTQPDFLDRVRRSRVALESCTFDDRDFAMFGVVRVANIAYHKAVTIRYTLDSWMTQTDVDAEYVPRSNDGTTDKFNFTIILPPRRVFDVGSKMEFAICYCAGDGDIAEVHWDNNCGQNYVVECFMRTDQIAAITPDLDT